LIKKQYAIFSIGFNRNAIVPTQQEITVLLQSTSFFRYLQSEDPKQLYCCRTILNIPYKKKDIPVLKYLDKEQTSCLLCEPNLHDVRERRDAVILSALYDTGARVQEVCDLRMRDVRLESPAIITLTGKGRKSRNIPIVGNTVELLTNYMKEKKLDSIHKLDYPLFFNQRGEPLTRGGITYILYNPLAELG
jgi:site-specific recombinase XerD